MSNYFDSIHVHKMNLWAHVGVLEDERLLGQEFILEFSLWKDLQSSASNDDLSNSVDYSVSVAAIQELALKINCFTIEKFSEEILDLLEELYGAIPMRIYLEKCSPPMNGFNGSVSIQRKRNFPIISSNFD